MTTSYTHQKESSKYRTITKPMDTLTKLKTYVTSTNTSGKLDTVTKL